MYPLTLGMRAPKPCYPVSALICGSRLELWEHHRSNPAQPINVHCSSLHILPVCSHAATLVYADQVILGGEFTSAARNCSIRPTFLHYLPNHTYAVVDVQSVPCRAGAGDGPGDDVDELLLSAARAEAAASGGAGGGRGVAPLEGIAGLLERHAELTLQLKEAHDEAEALRLGAELQERLASFDAQIAAGEIRVYLRVLCRRMGQEAEAGCA